MKGTASSPGVGVGRIYILKERDVPIASCVTVEPESELERFRKGVEIAADYYRKLTVRIRERIGAEDAEIFEGHLELLTGEDLAEGVQEAILEEELAAEAAVMQFARATAEEFRQLESDYFRQRAGDIVDIGRRLAEAIYYGSISDPGALPEGCIIVAEELTPSSTARLDTDRVVAIATEKGGRTSHAAIIARSLSIPCVTGVSGLLAGLRPGQLVIVDGDAGTIETEVDEEKAALAEERRRQQTDLERRRMEWSASTRAMTGNGTPLTLAANVGGLKDAEQAVRCGAEGAGLFRSEFVFMRYSDFPGLEQQAAEYRTVCRTLAPGHVIVRLLDCGADKPLPYAPAIQEDNPFLGLRGIRYLSAQDGELRTQVTAIAKVAQEGFPIRLMIPMVISVEEIRTVRAMLEEVAPHPALRPPVGIMVETPSSVMIIDRLAAESDFISIGTNDLVQYTLAVDRGNPGVAHLYQELHPAVLQAIDRVVSACHKAGVPVGVCGDMASHPKTALALLALGVDELSASTGAIPELKAVFLGISDSGIEGLRSALLACEDASSADTLLSGFIPGNPAPWKEM
jgi:phosphoenolpyruvate-protein phosphotransferase